MHPFCECGRWWVLLFSNFEFSRQKLKKKFWLYDIIAKNLNREPSLLRNTQAHKTTPAKSLQSILLFYNTKLLLEVMLGQVFGHSEQRKEIKIHVWTSIVCIGSCYGQITTTMSQSDFQSHGPRIFEYVIISNENAGFHFQFVY